MRNQIAPLFQFLALLISVQAARSLTVDLGYSVYEGLTPGNGINEWFGIRYAAPPLENLRFRAPQDPLSTSDVQIADTHGDICLPSPSTGLTSGASEDCLFLDVYAPADSTSPSPVFVWFQGGGFNENADPNFNGTSLIQAGDNDIVIVTFNYRVGVFGFLTSSEVQEDGDLNVGLLDQRKVLEWVQKYISLFGGDPTQVTIGGDSAGGASVDLHLSAYGGRDDGLFRAAAAESQSFGPQFTVAESQYQYDALLKRVKCADLACLRALDVSVIAENNINIPTPGGGGGNPVYMYSNVIDGDFVTDYTYNLFSQGKFVKVPTIWGDVTNEGTRFAPQSTSSYSEMNTFLKNNYPRLTPTQLSQIDSLYPEGRTYPNAQSFWPTASAAYGEMRYICPGIYLPQMFVQHGQPNIWNYHWDVLTAANEASGFGVMHVEEVGSIWGFATEDVQRGMRETVQGYWTSFIRTGDPNLLRREGSPVWESWGGVGETMAAATRRRRDKGGGWRLLFPNEPAEVKMEMVSEDQADRCEYLSSIAVSIQQ